MACPWLKAFGHSRRSLQTGPSQPSLWAGQHAQRLRPCWYGRGKKPSRHAGVISFAPTAQSARMEAEMPVVDISDDDGGRRNYELHPLHLAWAHGEGDSAGMTLQDRLEEHAQPSAPTASTRTSQRGQKRCRPSAAGRAGGGLSISPGIGMSRARSGPSCPWVACQALSGVGLPAAAGADRCAPGRTGASLRTEETEPGGSNPRRASP